MDLVFKKHKDKSNNSIQKEKCETCLRNGPEQRQAKKGSQSVKQTKSWSVEEQEQHFGWKVDHNQLYLLPICFISIFIR